MRDTCAAHAGNRAEPFLQIAVKRDNFRILVSRLPRVHLEQQQVFAVESQLDRLQIRKRTHEQPGCHQHQQGDRDLTDHEHSAQAGAPERMLRTRLTRSRCLQGRHHVHTRRLKRRSQSEQQTRDHRQRHRRAQHVPVQIRMQSEILAPVRQQNRKESNPPHREQYAQRAADRRQQQAFGQQLADHAESSGAQTQPHRHFAPPRRRSRQQEIRDIGACNGQDQPHHDQQHVQRLRILSPQRIQAGRAFSDQQLRQIGPLPIVGCRRRDPLVKHRTQRGLRLHYAHARTQARHDFDPIVVRIEISIGDVARSSFLLQQEVGVQRNIEIGRRRGIDAEKSRRRDSRYRERDVIDQDELPGRARCIAEAPLTEREAQDSDRRRSRPIVIRNNHPPGSRRHGEPTKIIPGDILAAGQLGLSLHHQVYLARRVVREHARKDRVGLPQKLERRKREDSGRRSGLRIVINSAASAVHDRTPRIFVVPVQHHQRFGIRNRQRAQQNRVHEAVDRGVGPDAKRQRQRGQRGECAVVDHSAQSVAKILHKLFKECPGPHGASVLPYQSDVSQLAARGPSRLLLRQTFRLALFGFLIEVELEFVGKLIFLARAVYQPIQLTKERVHFTS